MRLVFVLAIVCCAMACGESLSIDSPLFDTTTLDIRTPRSDVGAVTDIDSAAVGVRKDAGARQDTISDSDTPATISCDDENCGPYGSCVEGLCACDAGYAQSNTGSCSDINECVTDNGGCDAAAACINLPGSYACKCPVGTDGDGTFCGTEPTTLSYNGLHGYIASSSGATPVTHRYGASF